MRHKRLKLIVLFLLAVGQAGLQAQESVGAAGGNASGNSGSASYSIGQVVYQTRIATNGSVAEGVQQPYEISVVTAIKEMPRINLLVTAWPNPTTGSLTLSIGEPEISGLSYRLYDMIGKILLNEKITANRTHISMSKFVPSTYYLKIVSGDKEIKTFKIIKTN